MLVLASPNPPERSHGDTRLDYYYEHDRNQQDGTPECSGAGREGIPAPDEVDDSWPH